MGKGIGGRRDKGKGMRSVYVYFILFSFLENKKGYIGQRRESFQFYLDQHENLKLKC